ncbi:MAG: RNA-binding S4 domain-containing protein [Proteobacteria bacterium]|nr:RNA-binding S4 domain-containing protein [Pseudomonadota bacterium]
MHKKFELSGEYIELIKLLKATGLCESGGQAKSVTDQDLVQVDGKIERRKKCKIRRGQTVEFDGCSIEIV